ncbi:DUF2306 domain-containing protein [Roseivirga echinicomitans]|uniref:DUF2306 domain-containing protein n=1 Tax=Roseivirga echinicomitans TaxID=296218 RepID=A0A150XPT9_9BACT|nr:DUF2306 domain-containing protein [Roseivirga echinicomitans]KYG80750.1 hypothetical protein AWN68_16720 [Roseivirga echinicomitans]
MMKKFGWFIIVFFAIGVGLYPLGYIFTENLEQFGLLSQKSEAVKSGQLWRVLFNIHIYLGGFSLLIGWSQFMKKFRNKYLNFHRNLGKVYVIAVLISGLTGLYIAFYAEGGWVSKLGFLGLACAWLYTTVQGYRTIRKGEVSLHEKWMIRSYAVTFAAVTLRIWLPMFQVGFGMDFISAYVIIAWLCWVPNLLWAEWRIRRLKL